ncbi:MAG TPA: hypothetical protein VKH35_04450 [Thermoanaerobaculia bacterium]|nr:hypothetical protein [Thermoanaerobaculia bacterium]
MERIDEAPRHDWKAKVSEMKSRGRSKLESARTTADRSLHEHPVMWAGVAAGAGLAAGVATRMIGRRHSDDTEAMYIIEAC